MIICSPYPPARLSGLPLPAFVLARATEYADKAAIIDGASGTVLTYRQLATSVRNASAALARRGMTRGDVVALATPNGPGFAVAFHAAAGAGAVVTTLNPLAPTADMARQLRVSRARWLVTNAALYDEKAKEAALAAGLEQRQAIVLSPSCDPEAFLQLAPDDAAVSHNPDGLGPPGGPDPDDIAFLPYSSGTTGLPKGVLISHRNLVASLCQTREVHRVRNDDVVLAVLPWYHIYGLQLTLNLALREGATVVSMPRFELEKALRLVEEYGITRVDVVPPIVLALAKEPAVAGYDLSSLRLVSSGAAPLGRDLATACARRIGCRVKQVYGMTELGGASHAAPDAGDDEPESIGPPLPGVECRVVNPLTGRDTGPEARGELLVRGPANMRGYVDDPDATAATIRPDGWLHTGDIVTVDANGWFRVVDRVKDIIKYKGHQVAPAVLEAVLLAHPSVVDAAVVGISDEMAGEIPKAFVVTCRPVTADQLMSFVAARVPPPEKVRAVEFIDAVPKSPTGKILRRVLAGRDSAPDISVVAAKSQR